MSTVEIIVVDGGSTDRTRELAAAIPSVTVLPATAGRGRQIAAGVRQAGGDVVLVLHADSVLPPDALPAVMRALVRNPAAAGGSLGLRYASPRLYFSVLAGINNLRARLCGIAFGDQGQFFRRQALPEGFPALWLMEDVELSFRVKAVGPAVYVPLGVTGSVRRWQRVGYLGNFTHVMGLVGKYIVMRKWGLVRDNALNFYNAYYRPQR
jgi:glycosyltransferase involved in cell wall biosynthesis